MVLAVLLVAAGGSSRLAAQTLTFDDLSGSGQLTGYGGLTWDARKWYFYDAVQPPYTAASGAERVYDMSNFAGFNFAAPVTFNGAWFAGSTSVQFLFFLGGNPVGSSGTLNTSGTPTFLAAGYGGAVDRVEISSAAADFFVMDDVSFNGGGTSEPSAVVTPEPATFGLLATGLITLAGVGRRKRRNA